MELEQIVDCLERAGLALVGDDEAAAAREEWDLMKHLGARANCEVCPARLQDDQPYGLAGALLRRSIFGPKRLAELFAGHPAPAVLCHQLFRRNGFKPASKGGPLESKSTARPRGGRLPGGTLEKFPKPLADDALLARK